MGFRLVQNCTLWSLLIKNVPYQHQHVVNGLKQNADIRIMPEVFSWLLNAAVLTMSE